MSHHLDSALSRQDIRLNLTDLYVFRGQTGTVFVMDLNTSAARDAAHTGFHPEARYEFKLDLNGDAVEELTYRFAFGGIDGAGRQTLELRQLTGADASSDAAEGSLVARGVTDAELHGEGGLRVWAGRAGEPFYIDKDVLGALGEAFVHGTRLDLSGWSAAAATDIFRGTNVYSIVLEVPDSAFAGRLLLNRSIGAWSVTHLATDAGGWRQINRAGQPMIQPIFDGDGNQPTSASNTTRPVDDARNYGVSFANTIAAVVAAYGTSDDPRAYGESMAQQLLPDLLRYQVGTPATFGFGVRNGRSLSDNTPEVMVSLLTNSAISVGLNRKDATGTPSGAFPYVAAQVVEEALVAA